MTVISDFPKLRITLTNSGIQKWNPPLYDILSRLIDANSQNQTEIVDNIIPTTLVAPIIPNGFGIFQRLSVQFSDAQILTLNTAPIEVIPAPGPNNVIFLFTKFAKTNLTTVYGTTSTLQFRYSITAGGGGGPRVSQSASGDLSGVLNKKTAIIGSDLALSADANSFALGAAATDPRDKSMYIRTTVNPTLGNAANTVDLVMYYMILKGVI